MSSFADFLSSQHQLCQNTKETYEAAVKAFQECARAKFENVYLDSEIVHKALGEMEKSFEPSTWNTYILRLRRIAKWLNDPEDEETPRLWRKVKQKRIDWNKKLKNKWLSEQEIWKLLAAADHPRDKSLIGVTWEGGFRREEVLGLTVGDCKKKSYGFDITVSGKTGTRTLQIVLMAPLLEMWLYNHPAKNDPQSGLWLRLVGGRWGTQFEPIKVGAADKIIKKLAKRAGIRKKVSLHWLRHTQCTFYADNDVNEAKMREIFGWTPNSKMPSRYTHLSGRSSKKTVLALRGVKKIEEKVKADIMQPKTCLRCGETNIFDAKFCRKCGTVLDREEAERIVKEEKETRRMMELLRNPNVIRVLERAAKECSL